MRIAKGAALRLGPCCAVRRVGRRNRLTPMFPMTLDTALNLIWVGVGVFALITLCFLEKRWFPRSAPKGRLQRLIAVLVVTVALFPSVSSSDDLFSFSLINSQLGKHGGFGNTVPEDSKEKAGMQLFRLLETLNHFQVSVIYRLSLALCCIALVLTPRRQARTRTVLCRAGRAPPFSQA
jgi:hypothetical protein